MPYNAPIDPAPSVYSYSHYGDGTVEIGEMRLSLDAAEVLAARLLAAVQRERAESQALLEHAQTPPERASTHTGSLAIRAATTETEGVRP